MAEDAGTNYMEEDLKILPFSSYKLNNLSGLTGLENASEIIDGGLNVVFCNLIAKLCGEISILYGLDESVESITEDTEVTGFLFDLSAFLGELECPYEIITCGALEERFIERSHRCFLFNYLIDEMKAARLFAVNNLEKTNQPSDTSALPNCVNVALNTLNGPKPEKAISFCEALKMLNLQADKTLQTLTAKPQPIFRPNSMDDSKWRQVNALLKDLGQDCRSRLLILLKRMDVTVNSFLWSDHIRKKEETIRSLYSKRRSALSEAAVPGISALLSATDDLLRIEPASSYKRRRHTRCTVQPIALNATPVDRGGRTDEIRGLQNETRSQQRQGFGKNRDGHQGGQRGHGEDHQLSHEHRVRQEYTNRFRGDGNPANKRGQ